MKQERKHPHPAWDLAMDCTGKFHVGQKVRTRGDFGGFRLTIIKIHNGHYALCRGYGKDRHFNMNVLEPLQTHQQRRAGQ